MKSHLGILLVLLVSLSGPARGAAAGTGSRETTRPLVAGVRDLGPQFTTNSVSVLGHDAAYSIPLVGEPFRALMVFGDTWTGTRAPDTGTSIITGMVTNTMVFISDTDARDGIQQFTYAVDREGTACEVLQYLSHETTERIADGAIAIRLWPMHGTAFPSAAGASRIVLFYSIEKLIDGPPPPANFRHLGTGIAVAEVRPRDKAPVAFRRITRNGDPILWGPDDPVVGTAVLRAPDGEICVYASGRKDNMPVAYMARVREGSITDPKAYRWFVGQTGSSTPRYSADLKQATPLFAGMPTEMSVTFNSYLNKYLAIHTMLLGPDIVLRTAPAPEGPWSEPELIAKPTGVSPSSFFYAAKEHPWLARDHGRRIYLTYIDFAEYWPHLLEVKLR